MIGPIHSQSTCLARYYPIWRLGTCARNLQKTDGTPQNGRDLTKIVRPMSPLKPNQTALGIEMWPLNRPTLAPTTCAKTPPLAKSP
jgi:hypothetical protein